jgi:hypothetical protein
VLNGAANQLAVLIEIDGGRLAGGSDHDDAIGAFRNMPVDQPAQRVQIETAILEHGRYDCNQAALQHVASENGLDPGRARR